MSRFQTSLQQEIVKKHATRMAFALLLGGVEYMVENTVEHPDELRYLDAHSVRCSGGHLSDLRVCTEDAQSLGSINGVLISPAMRQLRYFVIQTRGLFAHRRYLLPVEAGAMLQEDGKTLRIDARKDELDLQTFTPRSVPEFSDDDLLTTMFSAA